MPFLYFSLSCLAFENLTCDPSVSAFAEAVGRIGLQLKDQTLLEKLGHLL
jgi:hypothetical protein